MLTRRRSPRILEPFVALEEVRYDFVGQVTPERLPEERVAQFELSRQRLDLSPAAAECRLSMDPRRDHAPVERLGDVVVRTAVQCRNHVVAPGERRRHDHGQLGDRSCAANRLQGLKAVEVGHHHVEEDEIEGLFLDHLQRGPSARGLGHLVSGAGEPAAQQLAIRRFVVDEQQSTGAIARWRFVPLHCAGRARRRRLANVLGSEDPVDEAEHRRRGRTDTLEIGKQLGERTVVELLLEHLSVAEDLTERSPQVVLQPAHRRARLAPTVASRG